MFHGCKMSLSCCDWHCSTEICIFNKHRSKQSFHTDMIQTHSNHRSTASSGANPVNLSIGDCSRTAVFPCYFRRTIKHCGINNGLTSSQDFFTSCLQKAWGKIQQGALLLSLPAENTMWTNMFAPITRYHSLHKWYCKKRDLLPLLWKLGFLLSISEGWCELYTWLSFSADNTPSYLPCEILMRQ